MTRLPSLVRLQLQRVWRVALQREQALLPRPRLLVLTQLPQPAWLWQTTSPPLRLPPLLEQLLQPAQTHSVVCKTVEILSGLGGCVRAVREERLLWAVRQQCDGPS